MKTLQGKAASKGIAVGPAFQFRPVSLDFEAYSVTDLDAEAERLDRALTLARRQLDELSEIAGRELDESHAAIFLAQAEMLDDPELIYSMRSIIFESRVCAEFALKSAIDTNAEILESLDDPYFKARSADVRDIGSRVLRILLNISDSPTAALDRPSVIFAADLTPSDTILLDKSLVLGFCNGAGGVTSHTAILARSLGLPAIVGVGQAAADIPTGEMVILDAEVGKIMVSPEKELMEVYLQRQSQAGQLKAAIVGQAHAPAVTQDGRRVEVVANIGSLEGALDALKNGAEGVGLLRTEFIYLERQTLPGEEEQYQAYREILEAFGECPVVLRTLDVGGDKEIPYLGLKQELNAFLGVRAIRLCLKRSDLFKPQLKAALRAGVGHNLKVMFPMIATLGEVRLARQALEECRQELLQAGQPCAENIEIGIMVEIPSTAVMADRLAAEVDFFSIGTNDLTQYTLAADRTNAELDYLSSAFEPAVLRLIAMVIEAAHAHGKWVGLCGELAGEPLALPILLGLGLDEFSMNPPAIPAAKAILRSLSQEETRAFAQSVLKLDDAEAVQAAVRSRYPITSI